MPPGVPPALLHSRQIPSDSDAFCQSFREGCDCAGSAEGTTCNTCCQYPSQSDATPIVFPSPTEDLSDSSTGAPTATETLLSPQLPASSITFPSGPTPTQSNAGTSPPISVTPTVRAASSSKAGPIAGGVIGAVILIALLAGAFLFWRRRKAKRMAPSAEFMHHRGMTPSLSAPPLLRDVSTRDSEEEDTSPPPPFSRGNFNDPIFEKLTAAAAQRQEVEQQMYQHSSFDPYVGYGDEKDPRDFMGESSAAGAAGMQSHHSNVSESLEPLRPLRRESLE
ncbi:hypothetical protein EIP91_009296 [Steccherinum ochraceum]|uniref:Uncharacterized protein n=1 Tax=Steccherinum ochraceum TaxID=92696 RepID=A0A4R0R4H0_9APHY|nr:hypothetical protein EIP91_009296 [Steccherinum ochraceum]